MPISRTAALVLGLLAPAFAFPVPAAERAALGRYPWGVAILPAEHVPG